MQLVKINPRTYRMGLAFAATLAAMPGSTAVRTIAQP
jgi:hypothetical protein